MQDKRNNPSNYSLVILSKDTEWQGYTVKEYGEADAWLSQEDERRRRPERCNQAG
jgi:hypothetical protein